MHFLPIEASTFDESFQGDIAAFSNGISQVNVR